MKTWIATPAAALGVALTLLFAAPMVADRTDMSNCVKVAAIETGVMSDACTYSVAGEPTAQCSRPMMAQADLAPQAMDWPGDFIAVTLAAAVEIWTGALAVLAILYDIAEDASEAII